MDCCLPRHITPFPSSHPPSLQQPLSPKTALNFPNNPLFAGRTVRSVFVKEPRRTSPVIASAWAGHCESSSSLNSPLELRSQPGKFLSSVLQNHRQLFRVAVEDELKVLADERDSAVSRMLFSAGSDEAYLHRIGKVLIEDWKLVKPCKIKTEQQIFSFVFCFLRLLFSRFMGKVMKSV